MQTVFRTPRRLTIGLAATVVLAGACDNQITEAPTTKAPSELPLAAKAPFKSVFSLEPLIGSGGAYSVAYDINDLGQAVGQSSATAGFRGVIWDNSTIPTNLGTLPGGSSSDAFAISNNGSVIVGSSDDGTYTYPVRWLKVNGQWSIDKLPTTNCAANSVSTDGTTIGGNCNTNAAVVWVNGRMITLGSGNLFGVNKNGQAVGTDINYSHAFLWTFSGASVTVADLGTLGGTFAVALSINDVGEVSGYSENADHVSHAFLYSPKKGGMTDLGEPGVTSGGYRVNAIGQVVGDMYPGGGGAHAGFFNAGKVVDLGVLPGYDYALAHGINGNGQVVGYSYAPTSGQYRATEWLLK
jgi:probable HAF family extracellular repeat protein